jgi:predicted phosphodiesterase
MKFAIIIAAAAARYSTIVVVGIILSAFLAMHPPAATTAAYAQSTTATTTATTANGSTGPADFNIAAVGDWGCDSATEDTVDNIISKSPEVVIGLGDNSYDDSADCWFETVDPIIDKMITAIGNEDLIAPGLVDEYMNRFGLSEQYYTYRYGNVFVLVMSNEIPDEEGSEQFDFVERSLSDASSDPDVDWIIVAHHRLMYTSPSSSAPSSGLAETYHELFEENDVDLVLQGHIHNYERSVPIVFNDDDSDSPIPTSTNGPTYVDPEGQIFATVGTGGQSIHEFQGMNSYIVTQFEDYGFLDIEIKNGEDGGGKRLVGTFYDNDGSVQDQFTVIKRGR